MDTCSGGLRVSVQVPAKSVLELWKETEFAEGDDWDEYTDILDVVRYARASKRLKIPPEFRPFLPKYL